MSTTTDRRLQAAMTKRLDRFAARWRKASDVMAKLEAERGDLFADARALNPPMTFKAIADTQGITEAAVQQRLMKHRRDTPGVSFDGNGDPI